MTQGSLNASQFGETGMWARLECLGDNPMECADFSPEVMSDRINQSEAMALIK